MTEKEFWKLYNEKYDGHMYISVLNEPLTGDHGHFEISCYKNKDGQWCIDRTIERCNTPSRRICSSEEEAFKSMLVNVHQNSEFANEPLPLPPKTESINKIVSIAKEVILNVKKGQS